MFSLGEKSLGHLNGVHPLLITLVKDAIRITTVDFTVFEGVRSLEKEQDNINKETSKLHDPSHCLHCKQKDGFGHAVDLVPFKDGVAVWDWDLIWPIANAMQTAALMHDIRIKWGAVWDRSLNSLQTDLKTEVERYKARHKGDDFLDGPHYELMRE